MKNSVFLSIPLATLLFVACSSSNGTDPSDPITPDDKLVELKVQAKIAQSSVSRVVDTSWDVNDSIGISCYNNAEMEAKYKNVRYKTTGDGTFTSNTPIYFINDNTVEFKAYYPYNPSGDVIIKNNTRAANQTSEGKRTIDYLWANMKDRNKDTYNVTWGFIRAMSQVVITFQQGEGVDLKDLTSYTISGLQLEGTFNREDGTAKASGSAEDLTLNITGQQGNTLSASPVILYPQSVSSFYVSATIGGKVYSSKNLINNQLQSGCRYNYTFTVTNTAAGARLDLLGTQITPWTQVEGGEGILYPEF